MSQITFIPYYVVRGNWDEIEFSTILGTHIAGLFSRFRCYWRQRRE